MKQIFISSQGRLHQRWIEAFPDARCRSYAEAWSDDIGENFDVIWLDTANVEDAIWLDILSSAVKSNASVAVVSPAPAEEQAAQALLAGARAYCHSESAPVKLREVASVLSDGGLWLPTSIMQRLLKVSMRATRNQSDHDTDLSGLTARERSVAEQVASGANNKEISEHLEISERTVKSHLSSIFSKLNVRDRVQLALVVNNVVSDFGNTDS